MGIADRATTGPLRSLGQPPVDSLAAEVLDLGAIRRAHRVELIEQLYSPLPLDGNVGLDVALSIAAFTF